MEFGKNNIVCTILFHLGIMIAFVVFETRGLAGHFRTLINQLLSFLYGAVCVEFNTFYSWNKTLTWISCILGCILWNFSLWYKKSQSLDWTTTVTCLPSRFIIDKNEFNFRCFCRSHNYHASIFLYCGLAKYQGS